MMTNVADRVYFVDVFNDFVEEVRTKFDENSLIKPYYMYGHPIEINERLMSKSKSNVRMFTKYPLIALMQDFEERHLQHEQYYEVSPTVLIISETKQEYISSERYEKNFKPTLYPLMNYLIEAIRYHNHVSPEGRYFIEYTKTDRVFWGKSGIQGNDGLLFNDTLDCIEINFSNLKIKKNC